VFLFAPLETLDIHLSTLSPYSHTHIQMHLCMYMRMYTHMYTRAPTNGRPDREVSLITYYIKKTDYLSGSSHWMFYLDWVSDKVRQWWWEVLWLWVHHLLWTLAHAQHSHDLLSWFKSQGRSILILAPILLLCFSDQRVKKRNLQLSWDLLQTSLLLPCL